MSASRNNSDDLADALYQKSIKRAPEPNANVKQGMTARDVIQDWWLDWETIGINPVERMAMVWELQ